jgi:hypothetical protein
MPDRGVDRPPYPDEVQHARRYANRLRQALTHGTRQIDKRTPGGRFYGRAGSMGSYEYALGPVAGILTDGLRQIGGRWRPPWWDAADRRRDPSRSYVRATVHGSVLLAIAVPGGIGKRSDADGSGTAQVIWSFSLGGGKPRAARSSAPRHIGCRCRCVSRPSASLQSPVAQFACRVTFLDP